MKILNLYAGIGGNRKLWGDEHEITSVEYDKDVAAVYKEFFPNDTVIIVDAHQYLLDHYKEFDFIWSSPPCPSHSDIRRCGVHKGQYRAVYPAMELYQEIILLKNFSLPKTKYVVENVKPYYKPLIDPTVKLNRNYFWSNFYIKPIKIPDDRRHENIRGNDVIYGFDIKHTKIRDKRKAMRNMVNPNIASYILDCALLEEEKQINLDFKQC